MNVGDITLCLVDPDWIKRLLKAADKYDTALQDYSFGCQSPDSNERNRLAGEIFERRKDFRTAAELPRWPGNEAL